MLANEMIIFVQSDGIKGWILHINILVRPYCVAEK